MAAARRSADTSVDELLELLEGMLPERGRYNLMRVSAGDYEVRTADGTVGRGETASQALTDLIQTYGRQLHAATPARQPWVPRTR